MMARHNRDTAPLAFERDAHQNTSGFVPFLCALEQISKLELQTVDLEK